MKSKILTLGLIFYACTLQAQYHNLKMPQQSNLVQETQRLGVTDITIRYSSPSVNGRDVWNDPYVIPHNGYPIAWRAGANLNTTIEFSTDVMIEDKALKAGKYGFHVIPRDETYTLLFAHNNNQWGSYYLDTLNDVTLKINVKSEESPFSEKLDYEFMHWNDDSVVVAVEWAGQRIPFTISIDLNSTVVNSFRNELRGFSTYNWQTWNDAAQWCLAHNTNLEEALSWANRSINGGFGGYAANKNATNLSTKARLLNVLEKKDALDSTLVEIEGLSLSAIETNEFAQLLLQLGKYDMGVEVCNKGLKIYPGNMMILIRRGVTNYYAGDVKRAVSDIKKAQDLVPEHLKDRMAQVITEMESGVYEYPYF